jgi:hypothetical protein
MHTPTDSDALWSLLQRLTENYQQPPPMPRKRGKQRDFPALSCLLLAAVAVTTRTWRDSELHRLLMRDEALRQALGFPRVPDRRTIGRRLVGLIDEAAAQISALGSVIRAAVKPAADQPEVSVIDGRMYQAAGPRWHKADRQAERVPVWLRNVDTESTWSKSGYRGSRPRLPPRRAGVGLPRARPVVGRLAAQPRERSSHRRAGTGRRAIAGH